MESLLPQIAFGYGRVSTAKQGLSREAQTETVQRARRVPHRRRRRMKCFSTKTPAAAFPLRSAPPAANSLAAVRAALLNGSSVTLVVTKVDRLGRDTVDVSQTVSLFESLGARIVFLDINVDTRTAMGRAFMQIAAVFAELERARIRERIQTALDLKRSQNLVIGTVPYGWDARDTGRAQQGRQAHPRAGPQRSGASHHFGNGAQEDCRRQPLPDRQRPQPARHSHQAAR